MIKILAIITLTCSIAVSAHADVTIAVVGPEVGDKPVWGDTATRGAQQAIDDINAQGGVDNEKLVLVHADDDCDPKKAVTVASQLAASGVKFVVGHACSSGSIPASKVYNTNKMLMISALSSDPALTDAGYKSVFRVCGRDGQQGIAQANYVLTKSPSYEFGLSQQGISQANHILTNYRSYRIGIIHDGSVAGQAQAAAFQKTLNSWGIKEALFESYVPHQKDYSTLIRDFVHVNSLQLLVVEGSYVDVATIAREIKKQGAVIQIVSSDVVASDEFARLAGDSAEGMLMTSVSDTSALPEAQTVLARLRKAGYDPSGYILYGYAAVQVIAQGIKLAGYPDPMKVAALLHKNTFDTAIGKIGFDANGDVTGTSYAVYRWHDGKDAEVFISTPDVNK